MTSDEIKLHIEMLLADAQSRHKDIELLFEITSKVAEAAKQDGENIRALARIAEIHERRLTALEGDQQ